MNFRDIRVFFSKLGNVKYVSHLDLCRAFSRAVKRAKLPVWSTEGFNPHIYMTFALPLALGIEGAEETVDLRLVGDMELTEVTERLNGVLPEGLKVGRTAVPVKKATLIERARYEITSRDCSVLHEYFSKPERKIIKKSKRSDVEMDVKPLLEWNNGVLTLPAGNTLNINPWNVLGDACGGGVNVKRVAVLCGGGELFE